MIDHNKLCHNPRMQLDNKGLAHFDIETGITYPENNVTRVPDGGENTSSLCNATCLPVPDTILSSTKLIIPRSNKTSLALTSENGTVGHDAGDCCLLSVDKLEEDQPHISKNEPICPLAQSSNGAHFRRCEIGTLSPRMSLNLEPNSNYLLNNILGSGTISSELSPSSISFIDISGSGGGCDNVGESDKKGSQNCGFFHLNGKSGTWGKFLKRSVSIVVKYGVTYPLIIVSLWVLLYIFWGDLALPGGTLFALITLEISAIFLGHVSSWLGLPHLTGMLIAGLILRNVPVINTAKDLSLGVSSPLRGIAVVILLTRGAIGVNVENIQKFRAVVPSLAIGSCVIEAVFGGIAAFFIIGYSPSWAALIGCIMSAMSGAAVMPYLLRIESLINDNDANERVAIAKRTLVIAKTACGLDAILAICMAECAFGFIFAQEDLEGGLRKGIAEVAMGGAFGIFWGSASGVLLSSKSNPDLKTVTVFCGGVMSLIGLYKIGYPRGGPLGVFLGTFIAVYIWRWKKANLSNLTSSYDTLWFIFQPLLFGIIGAKTDLQIVEWDVIYKGAICLGISMMGRVIGSFLMTSWSDLPIRERIFLVVAWSGKGTVQAALGPVALDTATDLNLGPEQILAYQIMNLATMTILLSSIIGFLALRIFGHRILILK